MKISKMVKAALRPVLRVDSGDGYIGVTTGGGSFQVQCDMQGRSVRLSRNWKEVVSLVLGSRRKSSLDGDYALYEAVVGAWSAHLVGARVLAAPHTVTLCSAGMPDERWAASITDTHCGECAFQWSEPTFSARIGDLDVRWTSANDNQRAYEDYKAKQIKKDAAAFEVAS